MSPITPGRNNTGSVLVDVDGLIRRSLAMPPFDPDAGIEHYQDDSSAATLSHEEANKLRDQVLNTFEEVKSKHELVTHLSERLRHIYSSSFLSENSNVLTPDLSSIPHNHPILSPLAIDSQYMERAEKEIARLEVEKANKCKEIEDLVFQMESMRSLHESEREKFRNERVALKSEIVELSVAVRGLRQNSRVVELEQEVKKLKVKNYELISVVNLGIERGKSNAKTSVCVSVDFESEEKRALLIDKQKLESNIVSLIRERDEFERISRNHLVRGECVDVSTWTEKCDTRDVGIVTPKHSDLSTVSSMYAITVPKLISLNGACQTEFDDRDERIATLESELESRFSRIGELVAERKALFTTIEDLEDEVSALRENVGITSVDTLSVVDQSVTCDIWDSNMREKYDKYKRQLLEATRRLRGAGHETICTMTELGGDVFDHVIEELQAERDMYKLKLVELAGTRRRECWSQTPEKRRENDRFTPEKDKRLQRVDKSVQGFEKGFHEVEIQTCDVERVNRGVSVDETSGIIHALTNLVEEREEKIGRLETELESERLKPPAPVRADDLSELIKPLQEKLVAPSSTCSPPSVGLFDYSNSTVHNQLLQTLSSFSPLRLEMSTPKDTTTPRDQDGDILMMTVARAAKKENIEPSNIATIDLGTVLKTVRERATMVSALSDRITYLSSLA